LLEAAITGCQHTKPGSDSPSAASITVEPLPASRQKQAPVSITQTAVSAKSTVSSNPKVVVYYFHPTFRCAACIFAESLTHQVIQQQWQDALDQGVLEWRPVNFDLPENKSLKQLFEVDSSAVVIAAVRDGKTTRWEKIAQLWQEVQQPNSFRDRIDQQITKLFLDK